MPVTLPRLVVAGLSGDSGKTFVSLGLAAGFRRRGLRVAPFKKGPDYIDAAWLGRACGAPGRNLDTVLMRGAAIVRSLARQAGADLALIEGNRGLFDGLDAEGTHSTAALARQVGAPVVLVVDATKATRTLAALVLGCRTLDPALDLRGVILNRIGTARQERLCREAIEAVADVPVLGALPRIEGVLLPSRHLGLVTVGEHAGADEAIALAADAALKHIDLDRLLDLARSASALESAPEADALPRQSGPTLCVFRDRAFSFYYPENLEALEQEGARLVFLSPLADEGLGAIDGLYAGGGFPEEHAQGLAANAPFRAAVARAIGEGLPVWAECGGLMYLAQSLRTAGGSVYPMVGALPFDVELAARPQGHGYVRARVVAENPFLPEGLALQGHEFHHSRICAVGLPKSVFQIERGVGVGEGRDGVRVGRTVASYLHLHALGTPEWAPGLVRAAGGAG